MRGDSGINLFRVKENTSWQYQGQLVVDPLDREIPHRSAAVAVARAMLRKAAGLKEVVLGDRLPCSVYTYSFDLVRMVPYHLSLWQLNDIHQCGHHMFC
jgi:hypothetical protein